MRYVRFRIRNFKGIRDTTVRFESIAGAAVFCFVGLNESGKTTILEAIHSFSPDHSTGDLANIADGITVPVKDRVPRHKISRFTGDVSVIATVRFTPGEKESVANKLSQEQKIKINVDDFPDDVELEAADSFKNGDFINSRLDLLLKFKVKKNTERKWRDPSEAEVALVREAIWQNTPDIAYFPTFVFDFPDRVYLSERGEKVDSFYRKVFQDILDFDGQGYDIQRDIIRRVQNDKFLIPINQFWKLWYTDDSSAKIQQVIDRASATVSRVVFDRWNRIFKENTAGKEIFITHGIEEGEQTDSRGVVRASVKHDIYIKFQIKDGSRRFDVNDRSLGFRWFFAFMLFTQFRVARSDRLRPILFLFDEPASNLHAAAQQKLIDCFPEIAKNSNSLAYTTHSHYMVEPKWLEQTFIVTNRSDDPPTSVLAAVSLDDESLDIKAETYRSFVNSHPSQSSYFQPILDRLEVKPSMFDTQKAGFVLEGKSDYYILRYVQIMLGVKDLPMLPALGAGTFNALVAIHVGWNTQFLFVLDADKQGVNERDRYIREFGIPSARLATLKSLVSSLVEIEDLLDQQALNIIQGELSVSTKPNKADIRRFFQERLASENVKSLSPVFEERAKALMKELTSALARDSFIG